MPKATPRGVDYFPLMAADILVRLYTQFPRPLDWNANDLNIQEIDPDEDFDKLTEVWANTVRWLRDESYIRFRAEGRNGEQPSFSGVVLAEKGVARLSAPNAPADNKIGDGLIAAVSDGVTESGHENIRKYIKRIIDEPI